MTCRDLLLEALTENLPARFIPPALNQLRRFADEELAAAGLACGPAETYATSRRLVLYVPGVPAGPAAKALPALLPRLLERLEFPQVMSWEASAFCFARPIRGLLALHGEKVVPFSLAGVRSGRDTDGPDAAGPRRLKVSAAEKYFKTLEHASVLVKDPERLEALRRGLDAAGKRMKLHVEASEALLLANLYLAECPVVVVSGFAQEFLALPPERLRTALQERLFFPVSDAAGRPQPYFIGVRDGASRGQRNVEEGYRRALEAGLAAGRQAAGAG